MGLRGPEVQPAERALALAPYAGREGTVLLVEGHNAVLIDVVACHEHTLAGLEHPDDFAGGSHDDLQFVGGK